ncbi:MAG: hypothetical protein ACTHKV_14830 [Flavipsychrobacter sp.]
MDNNTKNTTWGFDSLVKETPMWAKVATAIVILLTTVVTFVVAGDPGIPDPLKVRITLYLKGLDMLTYGVMRMFGINDANTDQ